MPTHIIIAGNVSNFTVFCVPIIISIVVYIVLTKNVEKRQQNQRKTSIHSVVHESQHNNLSISSDSSYSYQDLPFPLNAPDDNDTNAKNIPGRLKPGEPGKASAPVNIDANNETGCEGSTVSKQTNAEIEAGMRSMKTNLIMLLLFFVNCFILFIPSAEWRLLVGLSFQSFLKLLLPTFSMVANFGPIKDVAKMYVNNLKPK